MKLKRNGFTNLCCSAVTVCLFMTGAQAKNNTPSPKSNLKKQPNIIFILADDMGYGDLGSYGQKQIKTPHLDQMAKEGVRFTDFYAGSTVCAPSRAVLMTGKHLGHARVRGNGKIERPLLNQDITIAEVLKSAGYTTGIIGKWGLGDEGSSGIPNQQGFDYFYGYLNQVHAHNHFPAWLWRNQEKVKLKNTVIDIPVGYSNFPAGVAPVDGRKEYAGDLFFQESLSFIEQHAHQKAPFFLYLPIIAPHANGDSKLHTFADGSQLHGMEVLDYGQYATKNWPEPQKGFAAMIDHVDVGVGKILSKLKALNIADNTLVIFTSDNGPHQEGGHLPAYFNSAGGLRGIKRDLYEGGIRVPMIAWGPTQVPSNVVSDHVAYFGDFMATAAEIAGVVTPHDTDSLSFLPILINKPELQKQSDYFYWEFYEWGSSQAIRQGQWKAVRKPMFTGDIELYDLSTDLAEQTNVAAQYPELSARFKQLFNQSHVPSPWWSVEVSHEK